MIAEHFRPWMEDALAEVLESMCFIAPEEQMYLQPAAGTEWVRRRLDFQGPQRGSFGISVPLATARLAASNFLGENLDQVKDAEAGEVIGEIANMACGTLLGQLNLKQPFDLSLPEIDHAWADPSASTKRISQTFAIEDGVLVAWLEIEPSR